MTFLYPGFLWALAALSIPILIHLFNFRRTKKVYFSSTRFIRQVQEATSSMRKLKHLLVLLSRVLFLFFLVLAFSQPIIPATKQVSTKTNVVIYLDNSASMSVMSSEVSALEAGINAARTIVNNFPPGTRYRFFTNDFEPFANSLKSKEQVLDKLAETRISARSRSAKDIFQRLGKMGRDNEVFWISDFQQSTFGFLSSTDTTNRFNLIPVAKETPSNIYIDTAYMENPFAIGGERNSLKVRLYNDGNEDRDQVLLRLVINNLQVGTLSTGIPTGGFQEVTFEMPDSKTDVASIALTISDSPVVFDNTLYAAINFSDRISIFEINSTPSPSVFAKVYGNKQLFEFEKTTGQNVNYNTLKNADLVILQEHDKLDPTLINVLKDYVSSGGVLALVPSAKPNPENIKIFVPATVESLEPSSMKLERPNSRDPFFRNIFQEDNSQVLMPEVRNTITWGIDKQAILNRIDGKAYLSIFESKGKVYIFGGPQQDGYSTFFKHALFVPIMYKIAASSKRFVPSLYNLPTENLIIIQADSIQGDGIITLRGEQDIVPSQRIINDKVQLDLAGIEINAGFYWAVAGTDSLTQIAFNADKGESKLAKLTREQLETVFGATAKLYDGTVPSEKLSSDLKDVYEGIALWKYAIAAALLFILLEIILLRFWKT